MTIPLFIPTKDRAPQLRLLLESLDKNAHGIFQPYVLYRTSDLDYLDGYMKLSKEKFVLNMGTIWQSETNFVDEFYYFLSKYPDHIALAMDDCIFYRKAQFGEQDISNCLNENTWCVSLRLGKNTIIQDYLRQTYQSPLVAITTNPKEFVWWNFRDYPYDVNYGFHFSWDGIVYRTKDLLTMFDSTRFDKTDNQHAIIPQRIENYMMNRRAQVPYDLMCSQLYSHVVCMNWNSTHPYAVHGSRFGLSMELLNKMYVDTGAVIDLDSIDFSNVKSCHEELPFKVRNL